MNISDRKKKILKALIDDYIAHCEPISSNQIQALCLPEVSSATIRSELGALEDMGYLVQPHKSAGRLPSTKAYRYYVDNLMEVEDANNQVIEVSNYFEDKFSKVEELIKNTVKVISDVTNYTSLVVLGGSENIVIRDIKLVDLGDNNALVVVITNRGVLKDKVIEVPHNIDGKFFVSANDMIAELFASKTLREIIATPNAADDMLAEYRQVFKEIVVMLSDFRDARDGSVYLEGADKIFSHKEFESVENVKNFLSVINTKEKIHQLISENSNVEMNIRIGMDESVGENMAVVSVRCIIGGEEVGHAMVIGPERMDYQKVVSVLGGVSKAIEGLDKE